MFQTICQQEDQKQWNEYCGFHETLEGDVKDLKQMCTYIHQLTFPFPLSSRVLIDSRYVEMDDENQKDLLLFCGKENNKRWVEHCQKEGFIKN